jgi:hypothetical protein
MQVYSQGTIVRPSTLKTTNRGKLKDDEREERKAEKGKENEV